MKSSITIIALVFSSLLLAQGNLPGRERIEQYKIKFITDQLALTTAEAQSFWPLYNEYSEKIEATQSSDSRDLIQKKLNSEQMDRLSDAEIEGLVMDELNHLEEVARIKKEYFEKFKSAVGVRKAARFYKAEIEFRRHLMERLAERRQRAR